MRRRATIALVCAGVVLALGAAGLVLVIASDDFWAQSVSFSCSYVAPDFDSIVYSRMFYETGDYSVVAQRLATGEIRPLSRAADRTATLGVSNGDTFVYFAIRGNEWMLVTGSAAGGDLAEVRLANPWLVPGAAPLPYPNLTPDGRALAFFNADQLHLADLTTGAVDAVRSFRTLKSGRAADPRDHGSRSRPAGLGDVAVGPNLDRAAIVHREEGSFSLRIHSRAEGVAPIIVREQALIVMRPRWLSDGSGLTFIERSEVSWRVMEWRAATSRSTVLFEVDRFIETAELHPNRRHLLLTLGDTPEFAGYFSGLHVYILDLESGALKQVGA